MYKLVFVRRAEHDTMVQARGLRIGAGVAIAVVTGRGAPPMAFTYREPFADIGCFLSLDPNPSRHWARKHKRRPRQVQVRSRVPSLNTNGPGKSSAASPTFPESTDSKG